MLRRTGLRMWYGLGVGHQSQEPIEDVRVTVHRDVDLRVIGVRLEVALRRKRGHRFPFLGSHPCNINED